MLAGSPRFMCVRDGASAGRYSSGGGDMFAVYALGRLGGRVGVVELYETETERDRDVPSLESLIRF